MGNLPQNQFRGTKLHRNMIMDKDQRVEASQNYRYIAHLSLLPDEDLNHEEARFLPNFSQQVYDRRILPKSLARRETEWVTGRRAFETNQAT
jgi:hypothetical protein